MRSDYLPWDDYFMAVGFLASMRSKDPASQVGACIVNKEKIIVSIGYNGMPKGCSDDKLPWNKESEEKINTKYMYVCHAEMNAILNKNSADVADCSIYVALFPCNECAKIIIQARIKEVIYFSNKHEHKPETIASKNMLNMAGISLRQYIPKFKKLNISMHSKSNKNNDLENSTNNESRVSNKVPKMMRDINKKRIDYISWEEYFMTLAFLSAQRSKDPSTQIGACIVNDENKIVGIGYNGMPRGCKDEDLPWTKSSDNKLDMKYTYVCHAVMNAIMNKNCAEVKGCRIYVSYFPCNECAKFIIQADIKEIIYYFEVVPETFEVVAAKRMFNMVDVKYRKYNGSVNELCINFEAIDWNSQTQLPTSPVK